MARFVRREVVEVVYEYQDGVLKRVGGSLETTRHTGWFSALGSRAHMAVRESDEKILEEALMDIEYRIAAKM